MFGWFGKKKNGITVVDRVWAAKPQKWEGCLQLLQEKPATLFVAWFEETHAELNIYLEKQGFASRVLLYRQVNAAHAADCVFVEHYPLAGKERELFEKLGRKHILVLSSLDEPLFRHFGGDRIADLFSKFGMDPREPIEHKLVTASIIRAQEKLEKQVPIDGFARSQGDWVDRYASRD